MSYWPSGFGANGLDFLGNQGQGGGGVNPMGDLGNGYSNFKMGWNAPTLQMGIQGIGTIGNLWGAWQSNKLAKNQLNFTKMITNTNLNNQIKSYNTALEDRSRSRAKVEGQSSAEAQDYVDRNRLSRS